MIRVEIEREAGSGTILSYTVKGHAGYADPGEDIVCAGVSAVTVGTVNAGEVLLGVKLPAVMDKGFLQVTVPDDLEPELRGKLQLQLESMVVILKSIKLNYDRYITIQDKTVKRR